MAPLHPLVLPVLLLLAAADAFPDSCSSGTCGVHAIHYPFWLNSSGSDCGYPGLGLACENNASLFLSVQSHRYRIVNIDYISRIVAVSDADAELDEYGGGCPRLHRNLTIDYSTSWLQLTNSDSNITFLYNCKKSISWFSALELRGCREGYDKRSYSYVLLDGVATGTEAYEYECEAVVVAPVLNAHKAGMMGDPPLFNGSSYGEVVKAGFEFNYRPNSQFCERCESSGGWCGYRRNQTNGEMDLLCFCDDGPTTGHRCGAYASSSSPHDSFLLILVSECDVHPWRSRWVRASLFLVCFMLMPIKRH